MEHFVDLKQTRVSRKTVANGDSQEVASIMFPDSQIRKLEDRSSFVSTELLRFGAHGLALGRVTSAGHEIELHEPDNITFLIPMQGRLDVRIRGEDHAYGSSTLAVIQPGSRLTRVSAPPRRQFVATTLQVPVRRLQALATSEGPAAAQSIRPGAMTLTGEIGRYAARILPQVARDVFRQPNTILPDRVVAEFNGLIDDILCDTIGQLHEGARPRRGLQEHHRVCIAEDIMRAGCEDPLSISVLAEELGITPRSLQLAFQHVHGISPRRFLDRVRLHSARRRLMSRDDAGSVTTIAMDCGFLHLGRFAQTYARAFGERPSETLARRRR